MKLKQMQNANDEPEISIIVQLYNQEKYIQSCIECISNQYFQNYEIIFVIDPRVKDDTEKILGSQHTKLNRTKIIRAKETGLSYARNLGIINQSAPLIWFFDVDDYVDPEFLSDLVPIINQSGTDIVFCNIYEQYEGKKYIPKKANYTVKTYSQEYTIGHFTDFPVYAWQRIQKKTIFDSGNAMFSTSFAAIEDLPQMIYALTESTTIAYFNKPLYIYNKHHDSATSRSRSKEAETIENIARELLPIIRVKFPNVYCQFEQKMLERLMRQMAFAPIEDFKRVYPTSIAHEIIKNRNDKTIEMKIFHFSGTLYYCILYRYTHTIWDQKTGLWDENV